jgi:hypothetical protein
MARQRTDYNEKQAASMRKRRGLSWIKVRAYAKDAIACDTIMP